MLRGPQQHDQQTRILKSGNTGPGVTKDSYKVEVDTAAALHGHRGTRQLWAQDTSAAEAAPAVQIPEERVHLFVCLFF